MQVNTNWTDIIVRVFHWNQSCYLLLVLLDIFFTFLRHQPLLYVYIFYLCSVYWSLQYVCHLLGILIIFKRWSISFFSRSRSLLLSLSVCFHTRQKQTCCVWKSTHVSYLDTSVGWSKWDKFIWYLPFLFSLVFFSRRDIRERQSNRDIRIYRQENHLLSIFFLEFCCWIICLSS